MQTSKKIANPIDTNNAARFIARCRPRAGLRTDVFSDPGCPTLKLRVTSAGSKSWVLWTTRNVGGRRKTRTLVLGDAVVMTIKEARNACVTRRSEVAGDHEDTLLSVDATAAEASVHYLQHRPASKDLSPATVRSYALYADKYWGSLTEKPLRTLTTAALNAGYAARAAISVADANNAFAYLRAAYRYWQRHTGWAGKDPFAAAVDDWRDKPKRDDDEAVLSDAALAALHARLLRWQGSPFYPLLARWLLLTGCRVGESLALTWDRVADDMIVLDPDTTKMDRTHAVPVTPVLRDLVIEPLRELRNYYGHSPFVFPSERTDAHMKVSKRLRDALHKLPGGPHRIHDLRRTVATIATELGYEELQVKAMLSHTNETGASGATRAYAKVRAEKRRAMLEEVQAVVLTKMGVHAIQ